MKELKNYQEKAIKRLIHHSLFYLSEDGKETIVFQAPTGSGKTFTMARFILELSKTCDKDLCFLWISIGKGELQRQSYKSVKREIDDSLKCSLLENEFFR